VLSRLLRASAVGIGLFCVGYFLSTTPLFVIQTISVSVVNTDKMYTEIPVKVKSALLDLRGRSLFDISLDDVVAVAEQDDRVKEAHVFRRLPGKINVEIVLKQPFALLFDQENQAYPISRNGDLLPPLGPGEFVDMPLLRGKVLETNGERRREVVDFLLSIPSEGLFTKNSISEVWYSKKGGFTFFVGPSSAEIFLGHSLDENKVLEINKVLKYMESKQLSGRIIDARFTKKVVVRLRNEN
tara:strand:+ start:148673 stop:149395 length:723 start_codon:yes stop_codon:yes gene_type:complete